MPDIEKVQVPRAKKQWSVALLLAEEEVNIAGELQRDKTQFPRHPDTHRIK